MSVLNRGEGEKLREGRWKVGGGGGGVPKALSVLDPQSLQGIVDLNPVSHSYQPLVQHRLAQWSAAAVEFQERHVCTQHKTKTKRKSIQKGNLPYRYSRLKGTVTRFTVNIITLM